MANRAEALKENVPGSFFVDSTCIDCDTCRQLAPATFGETGEFSFVQLQPRDRGESRARPARIGGLPHRLDRDADRPRCRGPSRDFPLALARGVLYCGFNSRKSFGGNSYFVRASRRQLADRFATLCGAPGAAVCGARAASATSSSRIATMWPMRRSMRRALGRSGSSTGWNCPRSPMPSALSKARCRSSWRPVSWPFRRPGHTRGHCALLYRDEFLFSGDHVWWSRNRGRLNASRDVCWYSWKEQVESVALLERIPSNGCCPATGSGRGFRGGDGRQVRRLVEAVRVA